MSAVIIGDDDENDPMYVQKQKLHRKQRQCLGTISDNGDSIMNVEWVDRSI